MTFKDDSVKRNYHRMWRQKRRESFMKDKKCSFEGCEETEDLELDHVDRTQKVSHRIWSWSEKRRNEEIAKCQILCKKHHWEKTKDDLGWRLKHGTKAGYNHYGCRCRPCTDANAAEKRETRRKKKNLTNGK